MSKHTDLFGKRILLSGGTTGIGRETLKLLVENRARVLTFGRDARALQDALSSVPDAIGFTADAATREGIKKIFDEMDAKLGGIDILVACAALGAEPIHEMADEDWRYVIDTNLVGYLACAREAILRMVPQGGGHLLFVGSVSTEIKAEGESVYSATKAGVQAFAETLRKEVAANNIRVSVVQPGTVNTDMQEGDPEQKRGAVAAQEMLHAAEVAEAIGFILTRSPGTDIVNLRIEPRIQKNS